MISWPGGSGVYPKRSIQCLSANLSHLYTRSTRKKWKVIGTDFTIEHFDDFLLAHGCAWCLVVIGWSLNSWEVFNDLA